MSKPVLHRPESFSPLPIPTAVHCLVVAARHHGIHLGADQLVREHALDAEEPAFNKLCSIAEGAGLELANVSLAGARLQRIADALPAIVRLRNGNALLLLRLEGTAAGPLAALYDPLVGEATPLIIELDRLAAGASGEVVLVKKSESLQAKADEEPFGFGRLIAEIGRERRLFRDIALAAAMMSVFALAPALFWQLIVDRVLVYKSMSTFEVLVGGMVFVVLFDTLFGYLRRTLILVATARIDARLSVFAFNRLLGLAIDYFERTPTGVITRDINEIWRIRNFLTGQLFGTVLDCIVLVIILPVMFWFSVPLTLAVLGIGAVMIAVVLGFLPPIRRRTAKAFVAEGQQSAYLVETVQGARTVKSLALEPQRRRAWDRHVSNAARLRREAGAMVNLAQTAVAPFEKLMTSGVIALAAYGAITTQDPLYVGALIAFGMLSQRVAQPLIQLAHLVQQFDEANRAVRTVAGVVNQPREEGRGIGGLRSPIHGALDFSGVRFRYRGAASMALDNVSFRIPAGSIFGIMGRSGSGKTTITRLLQGLHRHYDGLIKVDGMDIRAIDLDHPRRSMGVVLQDSFLFAGSIRDNIGAAMPGASFEQIVTAARLAGAEEFIERLPRGYDTLIEEGAANLSGGQRQRIAIARALLTNPPLLILDEATSALDPESEAMINANLSRIAKDRTVVVISHRLSSLVVADAILVLDQGRAVDLGKHDQLLARCEIYRHLWRQQNRHAVAADLETRDTHVAA
ncbi:MAG: peptidase domain-containing ABC transporter [Alphaproteobacteria bacterium]|nr:peptidase domain-containing ABC transporter [Alphaproteobacteria bacterium]